MFSDVAGSTAMMAQSESAGLRARELHRQAVHTRVIQYHGEWIEAPGDETLSTFSNALDAVNCALAIQADLAADPELSLHIGIHTGDVVFRGGEIYGDGVNIASRVCAMSEPGSLCVSSEVYQSVRNQPSLKAESLGEQDFKNVGRPVPVYAITGAPLAPAPVGARRRGRLWLALAGAVGVLAAIGAWNWMRLPPPASEIRSIAVLPLVNLSADPAQDYFVDGMTEAITADLARIGSLRVISRTSSMRYRGTDKSIPEIAKELNVDAVIEGSVLRDGERVRITAQLIHAPTDSHLWAESYEHL